MIRHKLLTILVTFFCVGQLSSQSPLWQWAVQAASGGNELTYDIAADASDNAFVCGSFDSNLSAVYGSAFSSPTGKDAFFAKYSTAGALQFALAIGGSGNEEARGIATSTAGDIYVTGYFDGTVDFDPSASTFTLSAVGGKDGFLAKYTSAGAFIWALKFGGSSDEEGNKVVVSGTDVNLTGYARSGSTFYSTNSATASPAASQANENFFGAKYNSSGVVQWIVSAGGSADDAGLDLCADQNNVYYIGNYQNTYTVYNASGVASATLLSQGSNKIDPFVFAFSQSGAFVWATNASSANDDNGCSITQDSTRLYITGDNNNGTMSFPYPSPTFTMANMGNVDIYLACITKTTGIYQWVSSQTGSGTGEERGYAVEKLSDGNLAVMGMYKGSLNYASGGPTLTTAGNDDIFVSAFSNSGSLVWAVSGGGSGADNPTGIAGTSIGGIFVTGDHPSAITFGSTTLPTAGGRNIFLAKTGCEAVGNNTITASQQICTGSTPVLLNGSVPVASGTTAYTWQQQTSGSWTTAAGTNTTQNYSPPSLTTTTLYRRVVQATGSCTFATNQITVTVNQPPSPISAGTDQTVCASGATLSATALTVGTGTWSVLSGGSAVTSPNNNTTAITGLAAGSNSFVWSAANGACPVLTGTVSVFRLLPPGPAIAGSNQTICATTYTLGATTLTAGTGAWTLLGGAASIVSASSPSSAVNSIGTGTNSFLWTVSNGICPTATSNVVISRDNFPSTAVAGTSQVLCSTNATLGATLPAVGTGTWSLLSGGATIVSPLSASSAVTALAAGTSSLQWSVGNGVCPVSSATMTIQRDLNPGPASAGANQTICATTFSLGASTPTTGVGTWSLSSGSATIVSAGNQTTSINSIGTGTNVFVWNVTNGSCPSASSAVQIVRDDFPTTAFAGPSKTLCATVGTLDATPASVGTGTWSLFSGSATITTPSSYSSGVTALASGTTVFQWSTSNGVCPVSTSTVSIQRDLNPGPVSAGTNQTICAASHSLGAASPTTGVGTWSVSIGSGTITTVSNATTAIGSLITGTNEFVWTVTNGVCPPASSSVQIIRDALPSTANAGSSQTVCSTSAALSASVPAIGTGLWSVISGTSTVNSPVNAGSSVSNLSAGTNSFEWTVTNGVCPASTATTSIQQDLNPGPVNAGTNQTICAASHSLAATSPTTGAGTWSVSLGTGTISSASNATTSIGSLITGTNEFVWTVINGVCPPVSSSVQIIRDALPSVADAGVSQTVCSTGAVLSASVPAVGTGVWSVISGTSTVNSPASAGSSVSNLSAGTNSFVWTVSNGACPASTATTSIQQDLNPGPVNAGTNQTICAATYSLGATSPTTGVGSWSVSLGTGTITSAGTATTSIGSLITGTNEFVWTVINGVCPSASSSVQIIRDALPSLADAGVSQTVCSTSAVLSASVPGTGTGNWSVLSGTSTVNSPASAGSSVINLSAGTNSFVWTVSNGVCPASTATTDIFRLLPPGLANAGTDQTICATSFTLSANQPTAGSATWSVNTGTATLSSLTITNAAVSGLVPGLNVFVWTFSNGICPVSTSTVTITRDDFPSASQATNVVVCSPTAILNATVPSIGTGTWSLISGTLTIDNPGSAASTISSLGVGTHQLEWAVGNGVCPLQTSTITVQRDEMPASADAGTDQQICTSTTQLGANTPSVGTGQWSLDSGTGTLVQPGNSVTSVSGINTGTSTFVWTISNGVCPATTDTVAIVRDELPGPVVAGPGQTLCASQATITATSPTTGVGVWSSAGSAQVTSPAALQTEVTQLATGTNSFVWTVTNGVCPPEDDTVVVTVDSPPSPVSAGPDQEICVSQATLAALNLTLGTGTWSVLSGQGTLTNPGQPNSEITALQPGTTTLVWNSSNGTCIDVTDTVNIVMDQAPVQPVITSPTAVCGPSVSLSGNVPSQGSVKWAITAGTGVMSNSASPVNDVTALSEGTVAFSYSVTVGVCPAATNSAEVVVWYEPGPADAGADVATCLSTANLSAITPTTGNGAWTTFTGGAIVASPNSIQTNVSQLIIGENIFRFTVGNGICPTIYDDVKVIRDSVIPPAHAGDDFETETPRIHLAATTPTFGTGHWELISGAATLEDASQVSTAVEGLATGKNTFRWVVEVTGCSEASDEVTVYFKEFKVPNAITPNGDGKNDVFHVTSLEGFGQSKLTIFDRWGGTVYQDADYRNDWKGCNQSGRQLADDTYFYSLEIPGKGNLTGFIDVKTK